MLVSRDTRGVTTLCPGALVGEQGRNASFQCAKVSARIEASVRGCGSWEVGRLASPRLRNAFPEKSSDPGSMSGCQRGERRPHIAHRRENMGKVTKCGGGASEPVSADAASSATISTSAEGSAQVQTHFEIATNLNISLGGLAGVEFANTRRFAH